MIQGWVCYIMYYVVFILLILNFFVEKKMIYIIWIIVCYYIDRELRFKMDLQIILSLFNIYVDYNEYYLI